VQEARIELARAESDLRLTLAKAGYSSLIEAQQAFDEQTYQIRLKALQQTVAILAQDPERNADRIKELNAQIEALEDAHQAKLIEIRVKGVKALQDAIKEALSLTTAVPIDDIIPLPSELNVRIQQISDILAQFGIKSGQVWQEEVDNAQAAFDKIKNSGVATYAELLQIREKLLNAKIGQAIDSGDLAVANQYKKELSDVEKEMVRLGISTDRTHLKTRQMFATWRNNIPRDAKLWKDLGNFGKSALEDLAAGFEQAVASSVLGAQSIGEAMKQMLASVLASIAGQAAVLSLFYLAKGFGYTADFMYLPAENAFQAAAIFGAVAVASAAAAYGLSSHGGGGGGETAGAPAGTQPIETSGATQTQAQPVQTTNVQRFAAGGMVFGPTLSILGDSMNNAASATAAALSGPGQTEVAIPLDDDRSTSAIAAAIVKHMPQPINKTIIRGKSLKHLIRDISHEVESGNVTLKASHAGAVRKRS
jgi:hypothetical protein